MLLKFQLQEPSSQKYPPGWLLPVVRAAQDNDWWVLILLPLLAALGKWYCNRLGSPNAWDAIHEELDATQQELFPNEQGFPDHHQLTLFRYTHWLWGFKKWPWSGWLVPVERSGESGRRSRTRFLAPDDRRRAKGIAGVAWCSKGVVVREDLPVVSPKAICEGLDERVAYARATFVDTSWVQQALERRNEELPRSYIGVGIKVKRKRWGSLVIECRESKLPTDYQTKIDSVVRLLPHLIAALKR